jgi:hypothetical protein
MIIGIDIDGTFTKYPEFFMWLGRLAKEGGIVYIITGLSKAGFDRRCIKYPQLLDTTWYDAVFTADHYSSLEHDLINSGLHTISNEVLVGVFKQRICKELGVNVMFDDKADIHRLFGDVPIFTVK